MIGLTSVQRDILVVIVGEGNPNGVEIDHILRDYYNEDITGGQWYSNLARFVNKGLVEKGKKDDRTNENSLTKGGQRKLEARREWEDGLIAD